MTYLAKRRQKQSGFTIIELMIATAVFSVIILVITSAVLQFSRQYYKGIIASSTQGTARALVDDIGRAIQFNGGGVSRLTLSGLDGFCVGTGKRYSFALGKQVIDTGTPGPNQSRHALVSDDISCGSSTLALPVTTLPSNLTAVLPPPLPVLKNPREQLGEHMRLAKFAIDGNGSNDLYNITVRVVYGDDDLLCSPTANDCTSSTMSTVLATADDLTCKSAAGSQFCAVSELTTTVRKRVN